MHKTNTSTTVTSQLRREYRSVLFQISKNLEQAHLKKLCLYCTGQSLQQYANTCRIFRDLEYEGKISWQDVSFLKEVMRTLTREDVVRELTEFELKRDLTLLLDLFTRKRRGLDIHCCSSSVKKVTGYLTTLADKLRGIVDLTCLDIPVQSSVDIQKAISSFAMEIDLKELTFSWNEFTFLVITAGELTAMATGSCGSESVVELCSTAAEELWVHMTELGSWEDFCDHAKKRCQLIYHHQSSKVPKQSSLQRQISEVVERFGEIFVPPDPK
ncbi:uncharacterized protein [Montipora capricornis]|uniref:uncharacterized protein n=1 Tax=Montipora capricornis TaxID=246305 RepID=UPI0035F20C58